MRSSANSAVRLGNQIARIQARYTVEHFGMTNEEFKRKMESLARAQMESLAQAEKIVTQTEQILARANGDWAARMARLRAAMDRLEGRNGESRH